MKYAIVLVLLILTACTQITQEPVSVPEYNPKINPAHFSADITNKYLTLNPGTTFIYEAAVEDGNERIEIYVTNETKTVAGVTTRVVWDRVWLNGELIEDTKDWYAQDREGNVWYFGEDTHELVDGKIINTAGAWETGVDGARPGIAMLANPQVGDSYRMEYHAGFAEDKADVLALGVSVTVNDKTYADCLQTYDYTPLNPSSQEHKYYCPESGTVVLEVNLKDGERAELIEIKPS